MMFKANASILIWLLSMLPSETLAMHLGSHSIVGNWDKLHVAEEDKQLFSEQIANNSPA